MGVALVCVMGILVGVWYLNLEDAENGELEFTISMDGQTFDEGDELNLTFQLTNSEDENVTVTQFWPGASLDIRLVNSSGERLHMRQVLGMIDLSPGYGILPGQTYAHVLDLTENFDLLAPDNYSINVTYINYHSEQGVLIHLTRPGTTPITSPSQLSRPLCL